MTTKKYEKIKKKIKHELMQEFVFPILRNMKDAEGEYKEQFVGDVLKAVKEKPKYEFKDGKSFLKQIRGK